MGISEIIKGNLFETVHPCLVSKKTYIGNVNGVMNAVITEGKPIGETVLQGEGLDLVQHHLHCCRICSQY